MSEMEFPLPNTIAPQIDQFTGRAWLLPTLLDWYTAADRVFHITGGPGSGKSMLMAWLAGHGPAPTDPSAAHQLQALRAAVVAAHFCQATSRNCSPTAFADDIAHQLTANVPSFGDALAASLADRVQITLNQQVGIAEADTKIQHLWLIDLLPQLRQLRTHVQERSHAPLPEGSSKRERLPESIDEAITQFEMDISR